MISVTSELVYKVTFEPNFISYKPCIIFSLVCFTCLNYKDITQVKVYFQISPFFQRSNLKNIYTLQR